MNPDVDSPLRLLSICSGIGAADLVCARLGFRLVGAVERQAYAAAVLLERMEEEALDPAPVWCGDVRDLDARPFRGWVDVVVAGIPCVAWSIAGKRRGSSDERHLGDELLRIVREVEPAYVIVENVPGFAVPDGLGALLGQLSELGFDAEWDCLTAAQVGAPHLRERLFVLAAHADRVGLRQEQGRSQPGRAGTPKPRDDGEDWALAHADRARLPEQPGQWLKARRDQSADSAAPDPNRTRRAQERGSELLDRQRPTLGDDADGLGWDRWYGGPAPESVLCNVDDGSPESLVIAEQLHALGNAWVPAQAESALRMLLGRLGR